MNKRIVTSGAALVMAGGLAAGLSASSASANNYPGPTPTPSVTVSPVINPFANCRFTFTRDTTFVPQIGQFRTRFVPAIACITQFGNVRVYDLVR
jgi:hypothetical protein